MFCSECGNKLNENAKFCDKCGAKVGEVNNNNGVQYADDISTNANNVSSASVSSNNTVGGYEETKVYQILSYLGILWLVGLLCGYKDDENVKFHVGQGMILTVVSFVALIVVAIVNQVLIYSIFKEETTLLGIGLGVYQISKTGIIISAILYILVGAFDFIMMIIGIKNVIDKNKKELPLIGKFAFYK